MACTAIGMSAWLVMKMLEIVLFGQHRKLRVSAFEQLLREPFRLKVWTERYGYDGQRCSPGTAVQMGSHLQRGANVFEKSVVVEGFRQELYCARAESLHAHLCVSVCGDENSRNPAVPGI